VHDEPDSTAQEPITPEATTRAASPEIQVSEGRRASLSQGTAGGEVQTLELAYSPWAATSRLGVDSEDDEEVAPRAFD
jgi:hypothetical protein